MSDKATVVYRRKIVKFKPIDWKHEIIFEKERYSANLPFRCWVSVYPIHPTKDGNTWRWVLKQGTLAIGEGYAGRDDEAREKATECWHRHVSQALEVEYREWLLENDRVENLQ